jgi:hypothetical protein
MTNYQKGKIYKIVSNQTNKVYIGSTTIRLCERLNQHNNEKKKVQNNITSPKCSAHQITIYPDAKLELIELYPCASRAELREREQYWIDQTDNCINIKKAYVGLDRKAYKQEYDRQRQQSALPIDCVCGGKYKLRRKNEHESTKLHKMYLNNKKI